MSEQSTQAATIIGIGIGSGGISTLQSLSVAASPDWTLLAVDSDSESQQQFKLPIKILIGDGTGSQGDPVAGRAAAEASSAEIRTHLQAAGLVFLLAGLGGGTGSGAAPVIAQLAKESGPMLWPSA